MTSRLKVTVFFLILLFALLFSSCSDEKTEVDNEVSDTFENNEDDVNIQDESEIFDESDEKSDQSDESEVSDEKFDQSELSDESDEESDQSEVPDETVDEKPDSEMVEITGGSFMMGCRNGDTLCYENGEEEPLHSVAISAFKMDKFEVTTADYKKCIEAGFCNNSDDEKPHYIVAEPEGYYTNNCTINSPDWDEDELSVNCISWYGADAYCKWVGRRLPTEAEWEYAASGTAGTLYTWGDESPTCEYTMMFDSVSSKSGCGTESVGKPGQYLNDESPFGVFDMTGNLTEWVSDYYKKDYYSESPSNNPQGPETGSYKVFRGGFWGGSDPAIFRNSARPYLPPETALSMHGFRCVK